MPQLSKRTDTFTDSVIRRMTRISLQYGSVNLSQGFPDFDPPRAILDPRKSIFQDITQVIVIKQTIEHDF